MFKLGSSDAYYYPVTVERVADGGRFEKSIFDARFKRLPRSETQEMVRRIQAGELLDADVFRLVLIGWRGVVDEGGNELPFSEGAVAKMIEEHPVCPSVVRAWIESLTGRGAAKN